MIAIISIVAAATIAAVVVSTRERAVVAAADLLSAALRTARDGLPGGGIRLLPDPALSSRLADGSIDPARALAASRWVELRVPPDYSAGRCSIYPADLATYPAAVTGGRACLVLEESPGEWIRSGPGWTYLPIEPTNWWGLVRLGERVRIGTSTYTVCGPCDLPNADATINAGDPSAPSPLARTVTAPDGTTTADVRPQYLLLVNGRDDDGDGFVDNGWDGVDNDLANGPDDPGEWEREHWLPAQASSGGGEGLAYAIARRPAPTGAPHELPAAAVVDLTGWSTRPSVRSRAPVDPITGTVDLVLGPDGRIAGTMGPYGVPTARGLSSAWVHLWVASRADVRDAPAPPAEPARLVSISPGGLTVVTDPAGADPYGIERP